MKTKPFKIGLPLLVSGLLALGLLIHLYTRGLSTVGRTMASDDVRDAAKGLGYGDAFAAALNKVGQITPDEFAKRHGGDLNYLPKITWDPTTATFFDRFNIDPTKPGTMVRARGAEEKAIRDMAKIQGKPLPEDQPVMLPVFPFDFRLNDAELAAFKQNGFVVSERLGTQSCLDMFYRIYKRDLPVLITTDAILHAWHRSYDALLEEVETSMLIPALDEILGAMVGQVGDAGTSYGNSPLFKDSVADADYFLAVARSLLVGTAVKTRLGQDDKVARTVEACDQLRMQKFILFGKERVVDFSQFKVRGHYEKSDQLKRYFRAMMWCGRIDLRVAGNPKESSERELASAVVLHDLLRKSGKFELWQQFDRMIQTYVGHADSMTFAELGAVLDAAGIKSPADVKDAAVLKALSQRIGDGAFGAQEIRGDFFIADPRRPGKLVLPRSFAFLGQRFAMDSWVTSKVVFDDILWDDEPVMRRIPSCLDVSFAVFANDHASPLIVERIKNPTGRKFRDGLNYQHNLAALRGVIDSRPESEWSKNLYNGWLGCLRELSKPTDGKEYPESMRTKAWAMKTLNTQQASWTQLRHDTILYVKQSYTAVASCFYPAGFVEPLPAFWAKLEQMAARAAALVAESPYAMTQTRDRHAEFLRKFADTVKTLQGIAEKELAQKDLTSAETKFLEDVIEVHHVRVGSGGTVQFAGWYPALFYFGPEDALRWDAVVADVHTNVPAPRIGDPGCVLHQGVGCVDLMLMAVDNGKDRMVYAGPVLSHYEFEIGGVARKSDSEWKVQLQAGQAPPRPEWTRSYLVPGENPQLKYYYPGN